MTNQRPLNAFEWMKTQHYKDINKAYENAPKDLLTIVLREAYAEYLNNMKKSNMKMKKSIIRNVKRGAIEKAKSQVGPFYNK